MGITTEEKETIRHNNNQILQNKGYQPVSDLAIAQFQNIRPIKEIIGRMGVMNALINIAFEAPIDYINRWINKQKLSPFLSISEKQLLASDLSELEEEEINALTWYMEGLYALMWLTKMTDGLNEMEYMNDQSALLLPNLAENQSNQKLSIINQIQTEYEAYQMLDFYNQLYAQCTKARLYNKKIDLDEGTVFERCKALTWALNPEMDWDEVVIGE